MRKVYIPIIVVLVIATIFTSIKWQDTDSQLQERKAEIHSLVFELDSLQAEIVRQQQEIESKDNQIDNLEYEIGSKDNQINYLAHVALLPKLRFTFEVRI